MDALTMQESLLQLQQLFTQRMDAYQSELQAATPSTTVANLTADFTSFRAFIMSALHSLQDQIGVLAHQVDNMEMRSRRKIILFHGLPEGNNEDTVAEVVKVVASRLKVSDFTARDISRCHRMGRTSSSDRPRPILCKVRELDKRHKIWFAKVNLKGTGITLSEFLTKARHDAFMAARQKFGINKCWTRDGFVFVIGGDGTRHRICSLTELERVLVPPAPKPSEPIAATKELVATAAAPKTRRVAAGATSRK